MPYRTLSSIVLLLLFMSALPTPASGIPVTLKGSRASMTRQNEAAKAQGYVFVQKPAQVDTLVAHGMLVPLAGNADYEILADVSYPYARPEVRLFIERLAAQYHEATGERLVVTSLTRPASEQPRNAHDLSVHPTGIAFDLRISRRAASRRWLETVLLSLERENLLDVTRERYPPHYHVALFPERYVSYLQDLIGAEAVAAALNPAPPAPAEEVEETAAPRAPVATARLAAATLAAEDGLPSPLLVAPLTALGLLFGFWRTRLLKA